MRVQITHLKAPWPAGAVVGDVLDVSEVRPWALGKCKQVEDGAEFPIITDESLSAEIAATDAKVSAKAEAEALGIVVDGRWSAARIAEEIAKKQAE